MVASSIAPLHTEYLTARGGEWSSDGCPPGGPRIVRGADVGGCVKAIASEIDKVDAAGAGSRSIFADVGNR